MSLITGKGYALIFVFLCCWCGFYDSETGRVSELAGRVSETCVFVFTKREAFSLKLKIGTLIVYLFHVDVGTKAMQIFSTLGNAMCVARLVKGSAGGGSSYGEKV